jgi:hypothetical protein
MPLLKSELMQKEPTLLEAALTGYQHEADEIKRRIADILRRLRGMGIAATDGSSTASGRPRRKVSAAARKRMAAAQRRRWAAVRRRAAK